MNHVSVSRCFKILRSGCMCTLQTIPQMFHKITQWRRKACVWLIMWRPWFATQVAETLTFHPEVIVNSGPELLKTTILERDPREISTFQDKSWTWRAEPRWNTVLLFLHLTLLSMEAQELQIKQSSPSLERILSFIVSKGLQQLALRGSKLK